MGKKNKVVKLTQKKIRYIIRYKTNNISTKKIAEDLKLSQSTVKRVWMHWTRTKMPLNISKFGRKKKKMDEASEQLILEVNKEQNLGARRLEKIIDFTRGKHIPHNAIHKVLIAPWPGKDQSQQIQAQKAMGSVGTGSQLKPCASGLAYQRQRWKEGLRRAR